MEGAYNKQVLSFEQVSRLSQVLNEDTFAVHGRGNFPTLDIHLKDLINHVKSALKADGLTVRDVRMNGGAASYILGRDENQGYNDLDLIFGVEIRSHSHLAQIKNSVLASLLNFLPSGVSKERMTSCTLKEAYVQKMVKISNTTDRWSLISLYNNEGKNIELKFVDTMKRQFEFSVDSFQIILDSLLSFYEVSTIPVNPNFFPTVVAESVYGCFKETVFHLDNKLIATRNPEEIRGGGLLKYCDLLVKGFTPKSTEEMKILERYMCSRFFIDFGDIEQQRSKLESYLTNHFISNDRTKYEYLMTLYNVVGRSTVCLMGHERRQTLNLISMLAREVYSKAFPEVRFTSTATYVAVNQNVNYVYASPVQNGSWQNYTNLVPCY